MKTEHLRDYLALWAVPFIGSVSARRLIAYAGGIEEVFKLKPAELQKIPGIGQRLSEAFQGDEHFKRADYALEFAEKEGIQIQCFFDDDYPYRLKQCEDSPLILFVKGQPIATEHKYLSMVGTRMPSVRGEDFCDKLIGQLKERGHQVVIVSGLAFGIDIAAHKAALKHGLPTIGVLAHGLDTLYPAAHRDVAAQMVEQGALVTEFMPNCFSDKGNFVRRNRIIAGLSDGLVVVESKSQGGALISAELANSYNRDVFALPGRITDSVSAGCNRLIKTHQANLLEKVEDIEYVLGWDRQKQPMQRQLFVDLSADEQALFDQLPEGEEVNIDFLARNADIPMSKISALLLNLEFAGLVKSLPGKVYSRI